MTSEEWHKVKEVLQTALELDPGARAEFLDSACGEGSVRSEVESLLQSHEQDEAFLERPAAMDAAGLAADAATTSWTGRLLGPYELLEEIGEGGMGAVYRALRVDGAYEKQVAVKLVRGGLSTDFFVSRFKNERQILAGLEHPNIARLLDGGVTEEMLPYVVLEYVAGVPIDEYCVVHDLSVTDRLNLFRTVCSAVQYAHQNLVVHRDIKPGNILVTEEGMPKLLDVGIAKILNPGQDATGGDPTLTVMRIMTPDFASPEQVRGDPITTSSDIYSLGVVLYLLLTGCRPYHVSSSAPHEIIKAICDTQPERPSAAVTRAENESKRANVDPLVRPGEQKGPDSKRDKLRRALRGDLDNIVLKALRKEPQRRYATVEQFSEDLRRHFEHLPVIARKDTPGYLASKFIMRHKMGVVATVAVALMLIAALVITVREERIAQWRFNDVRTLANSLIFDVHDSIKDLPGSTPARKLIVDRALQYLDSLSRESGGDLSLQRELAAAYERVGLVQGQYLQNSLGDTKGSLLSYKKALQIRGQIEAKTKDWNDRLDLAQNHRRVANQQWAMGDRRGALENIFKAVAISESLNETHPNTAKVLRELGIDYGLAGELNAPAPLDGPSGPAKNFKKAVAVDEAILRINPDDFSAMDAYAIDLFHVGLALESDDSNTALPYYTKELGIEQTLHQRSADTRYSRGVAHAYGDLARAYEKKGDHSLALENYARGLAIFQELIRVDPRNTLMQQSLAIAYINNASESAKLGITAESFEFTKNSLEIMRAVVASAPENRQQRGTLAAISVAGASIFLRLDRPLDALKEFDEARSLYESLHRPDSAAGPSLEAAACREKMGEAAARVGNTKLATEYFQQALAAVEPLLSAQAPDLAALYTAADAYSGLGDIKREEARHRGRPSASQQSNWNEARSWYLKSLDAWHRIEKPSHESPDGFDVGDPAQVAKKLQLCETALRGLGVAVR